MELFFYGVMSWNGIDLGVPKWKERKLIAFSWHNPILHQCEYRCFDNVQCAYMSNQLDYRTTFKIVQIFMSWVRVLIMREQDTTVNFYQSRSHKSPSVCSLHWHKWNPSFSCSTEKSRKSAFSSLGWGKQSRAHIVGRHVTVCQLLSHRGSMSTTAQLAGVRARKLLGLR